MPKTDPQDEQTRLAAVQQDAIRWRALVRFVEYGNRTSWPGAYRDRYALALAVQRALVVLLEYTRSGAIQAGEFAQAWFDWSAAVETEVGGAYPDVVRDAAARLLRDLDAGALVSNVRVDHPDVQRHLRRAVADDLRTVLQYLVQRGESVPSLPPA